MQYTEKTVLPGLVKVFLILSYGWAVSLALAALGLTGLYLFDRYILDGEALVGAMFFTIAALCAVYAIVSIHGRSTSAPSACRIFCAFLIVVYALLAVRLLIAFNIYGGRFRFGGYSTPLLLVPALVSVSIPFFIGWFRYFAASSRVAETFGTLSPAGAKKLPPLGVGLLTVLCGMALTGNTVALFSLLAAVGLEPGGILFYLFPILLPGIAFPLALLLMTKRPGAGAMTVACVLWAWMFFASLIGFGPWLIIALTNSANMNMSAAGNFIWLTKMIPVPTVSLAVFAAALSWRCIAVPEEGEWLRQPAQLGRAMYARLPLAAFFVLYLVFGYASLFGNDIPHAAAGLVMGAVGIWAAYTRLDTDIPYRSQRTAAMVIVSAFAVLLCISFVMRFLISPEILRHTLLYLSRDLLNAGVCVYVVTVLAKQRIGERSPFAMPLPAGAFYLMCVCTLIGGVLFLAMYACSSLAGLSDSGMYHNGMELGGLLLRPDFWLGSFVCPGVAVLLFRKKVPGLGALIAVCVVWLLATGLTQVVLVFWKGAAGMGFASAEWFEVVTILPLFIAYLLYSQEFAAWRRIGTAPPA